MKKKHVENLWNTKDSKPTATMGNQADMRKPYGKPTERPTSLNQRQNHRKTNGDQKSKAFGKVNKNQSKERPHKDDGTPRKREINPMQVVDHQEHAKSKTDRKRRDHVYKSTSIICTAAIAASRIFLSLYIYIYIYIYIMYVYCNAYIIHPRSPVWVVGTCNNVEKFNVDAWSSCA